MAVGTCCRQRVHVTGYICQRTSGDLYDFMLRRRGILSRGTVLDLGRQLAAGLAHLHRADVAHRDLKLANALLFFGGNGGASHGGGGGPGDARCAGGGGGSGAGAAHVSLKIADLGLGIDASQLTPLRALEASLPAAERSALHGATRGVSCEPCGTATTMAPEVLQARLP